MAKIKCRERERETHIAQNPSLFCIHHLLMNEESYHASNHSPLSPDNLLHNPSWKLVRQNPEKKKSATQQNRSTNRNNNESRKWRLLLIKIWKFFTRKIKLAHNQSSKEIEFAKGIVPDYKKKILIHHPPFYTLCGV